MEQPKKMTILTNLTEQARDKPVKDSHNHQWKVKGLQYNNPT